MNYIKDFKNISYADIPLVGGKNASLGEMIRELDNKGVRVPGGFALTTDFYWEVVKENEIEKDLKNLFSRFDVDKISDLQKLGKKARHLFLKANFSDNLRKEIFEAYKKLGEEHGEKRVSVAVRSSGVAEDAPTDSFAGQFETLLNVKGKKDLLEAVKECLASTFNDRVIAYREEKGISHLEFALSIGVQKMVASSSASSGVMFTVDTETGFDKVVLINSTWGVGEMIVQGKVTPDEFYIFKPTLEEYDSIILKNLGTKKKKLVHGRKKSGLVEKKVKEEDQKRFTLDKEEILTLARWAVIIEKHYGRPQDIEWAKDGETGDLFIVQSRPETVHTPEKKTTYREYKLQTDEDPILEGIAIGDKIGWGKAKIIKEVSNSDKFKKGDVLVTKMTDPDWVPLMRMASAIVTEEGSKVCHAAIVSREMGIPCIVGTGTATKDLKKEGEITVDCTHGMKGRVFKGKVDFKVEEFNLEEIPDFGAKIMMNIGAPESAFSLSFLPVEGVGLAREEFIIAEKIKVHPLALNSFKELKSKVSSSSSRKEKNKLEKIVKEIEEITIEHEDKKEYFVKELAEGIAQIAAAFWPGEVIVRFSDFKTNEYRNLVGGELFEEKEANPMIGFRGAGRYLDEEFKPAFKMECAAIKRVRNEFGLKNISLLVPFCRTVEEGKKVLKLIRESGLERGENLKVYVMCEVPSNVFLAEEFLEIFDGMSIGTNDLTQLVLGVDRDTTKVAPIFDERNKAVKKAVSRVIRSCRKENKYSGICGQAPSDYPEFAHFLLEEKIGSISLNPDVVVKTLKMLEEMSS